MISLSDHDRGGGHWHNCGNAVDPNRETLNCGMLRGHGCYIHWKWHVVLNFAGDGTLWSNIESVMQTTGLFAIGIFVGVAAGPLRRESPFYFCCRRIPFYRNLPNSVGANKYSTPWLSPK